MSTQKQFEAAVQVIQGLPKDGPYQPSNEMMLKFYSYYKQATEGDCDISKPAFWEVVKRAKYEAWAALRGMSKQSAMEAYVEELKKIIETMSFSTDVATFMEVLGPFYEFVKPEDEEEEREGSTSKGVDESSRDSGNDLGAASKTDKDLIQSLGKYDDEVFSVQPKALESSVQDENATNPSVEGKDSISDTDRLQPTSESDEEYEDVREEPSEEIEAISNVVCQDHEQLRSIQSSIEALRKDMELMKTRISALEHMYQQLNLPTGRKLLNIPEKGTIALLVIWPVLVQGMIMFLKKLRK